MELNTNLSEKAKYDFELVCRAREKGDQKAYAELLERYRDSVYYMLMKMVPNKDDADDLTIEAFGKAFKRLEQYSPNYAFSTWLFKIASNNCIDFIRKKKLENVMSIDKTFEGPEGGGITISLRSSQLDPEESVIRKQKVLLMREVVEKLKPKYRTLVELRYFKEYSYEEIADQLNLPVGTVKAQLFRAREFLYNIMKHNQGRI